MSPTQEFITGTVIVVVGTFIAVFLSYLRVDTTIALILFGCSIVLGFLIQLYAGMRARRRYLEQLIQIENQFRNQSR